MMTPYNSARGMNTYLRTKKHLRELSRLDANKTSSEFDETRCSGVALLRGGATRSWQGLAADSAIIIGCNGGESWVKQKQPAVVVRDRNE